MDALDDPFAVLDRELSASPLGLGCDAVFVDVHAEATSEKWAIGHFADGRASLIAGTHTHVPSADHRILPGGTGFVTDVGMTGDYDSVIGMEKEEPLGASPGASPPAGSSLRPGRRRFAASPRNSDREGSPRRSRQCASAAF